MIMDLSDSFILKLILWRRTACLDFLALGTEAGIGVSFRSAALDLNHCWGQCTPDLDAATVSHTAMNIAAITGPITKPFRPKIAMPPKVEIKTT